MLGFSLILSTATFTSISYQISENVQALTSFKSSTTICVNQSSVYISLNDFHARCTHGNRQGKGIKIAYAIEGFHPPILGISEANLFQDHDKQAVQVQDNNLHTYPTISNPGLKSVA